MPAVAVMGPGPGYEKHPEHKVELRPSHQRVRVVYQGAVIADTRDAIIVHESNYDPVAYIPRSDVRSEFLKASARETHCPFKGYASYWSIELDGKVAENAAWAYPRSYEEVSELADRIAFDRRFLDEVIISEH